MSPLRAKVMVPEEGARSAVCLRAAYFASIFICAF